jgi:amino-acid N-acetyltransferase
VRELVMRAGLPVEGLEEQFPAAFVVAQQAGDLVGAAGLERYGAGGLLRSVVVAERCRRTGVGRALVRDRLRAAAASELDRVFLLTTTAATYFEHLGFVAAARSEAPPLLAASVEFARACPDSATCLVYELQRS